MKTNHDTQFRFGTFFKQRFPSKDSKDGTTEFATAIHSSLQDRDHLIIKAPKGASRSVGMLVPAIYQSAFNGKHVVIACAGEQDARHLTSHVLPELCRALPWEFSIGSLHLREEYLCLQKYVDAHDYKTIYDVESETEKALVETVRSWAPQTKTGDLGELPFRLPARLEKRLSSRDHECRGKYCRFSWECHYRNAQLSLKDKDIVVCDHRTLFRHVAALSRPSGLPGYSEAILPKFDVAIIDECAWAETSSQQAFGFAIGVDRFRSAAAFLSDDAQYEQWAGLVSEYETYLDKLRRLRAANGKSRFCLPLTPRADVLIDKLNQTAWEYAEAAYHIEQFLGGDCISNAKYRRAERECRILQRQLEFISSPKNVNWLLTINDDAHGLPELFCEPKQLREVLQPLFAEACCVFVGSTGLSVREDLESYQQRYGVPSPRIIFIDPEEKSDPSDVPVSEEQLLCSVDTQNDQQETWEAEAC